MVIVLIVIAVEVVVPFHCWIGRWCCFVYMMYFVWFECMHKHARSTITMTTATAAATAVAAARRRWRRTTVIVMVTVTIGRRTVSWFIEGFFLLLQHWICEWDWNWNWIKCSYCTYMCVRVHVFACIHNIYTIEGEMRFSLARQSNRTQCVAFVPNNVTSITYVFVSEKIYVCWRCIQFQYMPRIIFTRWRRGIEKQKIVRFDIARSLSIRDYIKLKCTYLFIYHIVCLT